VTQPPGAIAGAGASRRASLVVLGAAAFMAQVDARVIDAMLQVVAEDFGTVPTRAAIVVSAFALPYGLFQLFYGPIGDRVGKLRVMVACLACFSVATFACAFAPSLRTFALLRFFTGVFAAAIIPMSLGYIGDTFPLETRQIALGRFMSAVMMGQILGAVIGGVFAQYLGWRNVFLVLGAGRVAVAALLAREVAGVQERVKPGPLPVASMAAVPLGGGMLFGGMLGLWATTINGVLSAVGVALLLYALITQYGHLLKRPGAPAILGGVFTEGLFVFGGLAYLASSLTTRFGLAVSTAGLLLAGFGVGGLAYSASVKRLVARLGDLGILTMGGSLLGVAFVAIGLLPNWQSFLPLVVVLGMGYYTMHGTLQTRATEMAPEARGAAISLFAFAFFMGQSAGPLLIGRILQSQGYAVAFGVAGLGLLSLAVALRTLLAQPR
jgi:YNFM family putative membrane transporter